MTHDDLLAVINNDIDQASWVKDYYPLKALMSLRAVVELHKPDVQGNCDICGWIIGKPGFVRYSACPTIQAIERELR